MRRSIALTIITYLLLVSLGYSQSDAPPPSRLLRRHRVELPPASRLLGPAPVAAPFPKAPKKIAQVPRQVDTPPISAPVVTPRLIVVPPHQETIKSPKFVAPTLPKIVPAAIPKKSETSTPPVPTSVPVITEPKWSATPPKFEATVPLGQRGTWIPVKKGRRTVIEEAVVEKTATLEKPVKIEETREEKTVVEEPRENAETPTALTPIETEQELPLEPLPLTLPPLPQVAEIETTSAELSPAPGIAPPPPIGGAVSKVDPQPIDSVPNKLPLHNLTKLPFYDQEQDYVCENCPDQEFSTDNLYSDYDEISPVILMGVKGGTDRTITDIRAFLPIWQDDLELLFGDIRGRFDDDEANEGQFGLGYRTLISPEWIFGVYGYYDLRKTNQRNRFNQFTTGIEFLSEEWDVRLNGYFPNESGKPSNLASGISNGTIVSNAFEERAARGFNAEVGKRILHWGRFDAQELRWFIGYYRFNNDASGFSRISGPSTRLEFRSYDLPFLGNQSRLTAGVEYTSDDIRDDQTWGFLRVQIPLAPKANRKMLNSLRRRFIDMPSRNID